MKKTLALFIFAASLNSLAATSVIMKHAMHAGFAPPSMQGTFTVQLLSNGDVESVNNKNVKIKFAKLSTQAVQNVVKKIVALQEQELRGEDGPRCMDAPSTETIVVKNNKEVVIKSKVSCRAKEMTSAYELNATMDALLQLSNLK